MDVRQHQRKFTFGNSVPTSFSAAGLLLPIANTVTNNNIGPLILVVLRELIAAIRVTAIASPARLSRMEPNQVQM